MFELFAEVYKSLASWPAAQYAAIVLGGYFGIKMILRGEKDKITIPNADPPRWFTNEQALDVSREHLSESRRHTYLLEQIVQQTRHERDRA